LQAKNVPPFGAQAFIDRVATGNGFTHIFIWYWWALDLASECRSGVASRLGRK
jgi:hypothetical protein